MNLLLSHFAHPCTHIALLIQLSSWSMLIIILPAGLITSVCQASVSVNLNMVGFQSHCNPHFQPAVTNFNNKWALNAFQQSWSLFFSNLDVRKPGCFLLKHQTSDHLLPKPTFHLTTLFSWSLKKEKHIEENFHKLPLLHKITSLHWAACLISLPPPEKFFLYAD